MPLKTSTSLHYATPVGKHSHVIIYCQPNIKMLHCKFQTVYLGNQSVLQLQCPHHNCFNAMVSLTQWRIHFVNSIVLFNKLIHDSQTTQSPSCFSLMASWNTYIHTYIHLTAFFPGQPGWAAIRKVNHSGFYWSKRWWGGISWTICKSFVPHSRQITTPLLHHSIFYGPYALPDTQPTVSKHWRRQSTEGT